MPFGIKLGKKGRYILSHKNSFLVRVQLLDNTVMDCTLTVENTGSDCLNAVANKLDLKELQYFGLQYMNKQFKARRWVELDKPLKKQVDKFSQHPTLFFGVIYYVADVDLLQQEITRYLFYLQLKNNIIDSQVSTDVNQAIELASYMLQAEFGDFNPEVHTIQFFRDYILFPEILTPEEEVLDSLTIQTLQLHEKHRSLTAPDAEYNYVIKVLCLDGYGEEKFLVKDGNGRNIHLGCNLSGVFFQDILKMHYTTKNDGQNKEMNESVRYEYGQITLYEWTDIAHVSYNKTTLSIDMEREEMPIQFLLEEVEVAKYLCRIIEAKRKFYTNNKNSARKMALEDGKTSIQRRPTLRRTQDVAAPEVPNSLPDEPEEAPQPQQQQQVLRNPRPNSTVLSSQENLHDYSSNTTSQEIAQYYASQTSLDHAYVSQTSLNHIPQAIAQQDYNFANGGYAGGSMYSSPSINSLAHSQPHLNRPSPSSSNLSLCSTDRFNGNIPGYRCTPDYDVALRQRRRYSSYLENQAAAIQQANTGSTTGVPPLHLKPRPHSMIYSPQELMHQAINGPHYAHYPPQHPPLHNRRSNPPNRVDSRTQLQSSQTHLHHAMNASHESLSHQPPTVLLNHEDMKAYQTSGNNMMLAASTPELANPLHQQQQQVKGYSGSEMQLFRHITKPPPPYPKNSNSTPDLSLMKVNSVSASSPDLYNGPSQGVVMRHPPDVHHNNSNYQALRLSGTPTQDIIIRGVCTEVDAAGNSYQTRGGDMVHKINDQSNYNQMRSEQAVQAYLQQISREEETSQDVHMNMRQRQQPRPVHRPVSYPPRLNHSQAVLTGVDENNLLSLNGNNRMTSIYQEGSPLHSSQSHLSSGSTSTGTPYGSQQQLHGSLNNLPGYQPPPQMPQTEVSPQHMYHIQTQQALHHPPIHQSHSYDALQRDHEMMINYPPINAQVHESDESQYMNQQQQQYVLNNNNSEPSYLTYSTPAMSGTTPTNIPHEQLSFHNNSHEQVDNIEIRNNVSHAQNYDPPHSYRQASQSDSLIDEENTVPSVFPHPNPTHPSNMQQMYKKQEEEEEDQMLAQQFSQQLRLSRHSIKRKSQASKTSNEEMLPDEKVIALERHVEEGCVLTDYKNISELPQGEVKIVSHDHERQRDRVKSVVPYEHNCVRISKTSANPTGYVNASHVQIEHSGMLWNFIACQNPLDEYAHEFWEMIWHSQVAIVVMLSREMESGKSRCARYWPVADGDSNAELYENYRVVRQSVLEHYESSGTLSNGEVPSSPTCANLIMSHLVVQKAGDTNSRNIWHMQYVGWPDTGAPKDARDFLALIHELESLKRLMAENEGTDISENVQAPVLVHCPSGSGKTGVLLLSQIVIHILTHNGNVDTIPDMLQELRSQRMQMVQTVSQYNFVYQLLISFLKNSRLI